MTCYYLGLDKLTILHFFDNKNLHFFNARFSVRMAMPWPPPAHNEAIPYRPPLRCSSYMRVTTILTPDAPTEWPSAIAPPFTFNFNGSIESSL